MTKRTELPPPEHTAVSTVPAWAIPRGPVDDDVEAAFMAGSALNSLDNLVRSEPSWAGAWRGRLALKAAAASVKLNGRREDEAALRDAWHLRRSGDELGPAGSVFLAWRRLAERSVVPDPQRWRETAVLLGVADAPWLAELTRVTEEILSRSGPAPSSAATMATHIITHDFRAEPLAWWAADLVLSLRMRWPLPVPILSGQIHAPVLRPHNGYVRVKPGSNGFERAVFIAAAAGATEACRLGATMAIQARRLLEAGPKLRSKGAGIILSRLFDEDTVPGTLATPDLSRWSSRRLFDRLVQLGAVREFTGRNTFKIYGL